MTEDPRSGGTPAARLTTDVTASLEPFDAAMAEWRRDGLSDAWLYVRLWNVFGVAELGAEVASLREALQQIADYDAEAEAGYIDEWVEANAFRRCQDLARGALAPASREPQ